jgi:hypothetical protein
MMPAIGWAVAVGGSEWSRRASRNAVPRIPRQRGDRIVRVMRAQYPPGEVA